MSDPSVPSLPATIPAKPWDILREGDRNGTWRYIPLLGISLPGSRDRDGTWDYSRWLLQSGQVERALQAIRPGRYDPCFALGWMLGELDQPGELDAATVAAIAGELARETDELVRRQREAMARHKAGLLPSAPSWQPHLAWLRTIFGNRPFQAADVHDAAAAGWIAPPGEIWDPGSRAFTLRLGQAYAMASARPDQAGELRIISDGRPHGTRSWRVTELTEPPVIPALAMTQHHHPTQVVVLGRPFKKTFRISVNPVNSVSCHRKDADQ